MPPEVGSVNGVVMPSHTVGAPTIGAGVGLTVKEYVAAHPEGKVYEIVVIPGDTVVTTPVAEPIVATPVAVLDHTPPVVASERVTMSPMQADAGPVIAAGDAITVTV
jgi:hypothetical protein